MQIYTVLLWIFVTLSLKCKGPAPNYISSIVRPMHSGSHSQGHMQEILYYIKYMYYLQQKCIYNRCNILKHSYVVLHCYSVCGGDGVGMQEWGSFNECDPFPYFAIHCDFFLFVLYTCTSRFNVTAESTSACYLGGVYIIWRRASPPWWDFAIDYGDFTRASPTKRAGPRPCKNPLSPIHTLLHCVQDGNCAYCALF